MIWLILFVLVILALIWKLVYTPSLSVSVDKTDYMKNETVQINGQLLGAGGSPMVGQTVTLTITPPSGSDYIVPDAITLADGTFSKTWVVPGDAVDGSYTLTAASTGITATKTFKQNQPRLSVIGA